MNASAGTSGLRYNLTKGKGGMSAAMALALRRSNKDNAATAKRSLPKEEKGTEERKKSSPSQSQRKHSIQTKVFVLLLEPKSKTFELIQLVYSPETTTIGDILSMIPHHATEIALGSQSYKGLCRPKDVQNLSDLSLLASDNSQQKPCAKIASGEIVVAIPKDYTAQDVAKFSQAILTNKRFTRLLNKSKSKSSKTKIRKPRSNRTIVSESLLDGAEDLDEQGMQRALEKAALAAAQTNSNIPQYPTSSDNEDANLDESLRSSASSRHAQRALMVTDFDSVDSSSLSGSRNSLGTSSWVDGGASIATQSVVSTSTGGESLDESLSSWSKSLDQSFASRGRSQALYSRHNRSFTALNQTENRRKRHTKKQRFTRYAIVATAVVLALAFMIYNYHEDEKGERAKAVNNPMGLPGLLQVTLILLVMKKMQFLASRRAKGRVTHATGKDSNCPIVRFFAMFKK